MGWRSRVKLTLSWRDRSETVSSRFLKHLPPGIYFTFYNIFYLLYLNWIQGAYGSLCYILLGRGLILSLQIWSAQRRPVNVRGSMKTVVTLFLCHTSRSTTTTSMISLKTLHLTQSDQSKAHKYTYVLSEMVSVDVTQWHLHSNIVSQLFHVALTVFVRWLGGGTPVRTNEFVYVTSKIALQSTA